MIFGIESLAFAIGKVVEELAMRMLDGCLDFRSWLNDIGNVNQVAKNESGCSWVDCDALILVVAYTIKRFQVSNHEDGYVE